MKKVNEIEIERHWCWECKKTSLHTAQYSNNRSKVKLICPLCKHISFWYVSVYPYPQEKDSSKQIDYIVKDIEQQIKEP